MAGPIDRVFCQPIKGSNDAMVERYVGVARPL